MWRVICESNKGDVYEGGCVDGHGIRRDGWNDLDLVRWGFYKRGRLETAGRRRELPRSSLFEMV